MEQELTSGNFFGMWKDNVYTSMSAFNKIFIKTAI